MQEASGLSQEMFNLLYERVRATEHAPRGPFRVLERRHCLAEVVERGVGVPDERYSIIHTHHERESMSFSKNASRYGYCFAHQRPGFFQALYLQKGHRVVGGC